MEVENLSACLAVALKYEDGYSNNRNDPGNWTGGQVGVGALKRTKRGIAAHVYPALKIKNLTLEDATSIYERDIGRKRAVIVCLTASILRLTLA